MAERGYALSALYPATARPVPVAGLGDGRRPLPGRGASQVTRLAAAARSACPGPGRAWRGRPGRRTAGRLPAVRRAGPQDARDVIAVLAAVHAGARDCGPATLDPASVRRWLAEPGTCSPTWRPDGFLGYGWHGGSDHEIMVHVLAAGSAPTARALWGIVASHASVTGTVHAVVGPDDPIGWLTREPDVRLRLHKRWMLRVLDPAAAISGRGFPAAAVRASCCDCGDDQLPAGAGLHTLTVRDGEGSLLPWHNGALGRLACPPEPVRLGPRGFAALYAGVADGDAPRRRARGRRRSRCRRRRWTPSSPATAYLLDYF